MTINIADNSPRISYSVASGVTQTSFAVPFEFFDDEDLNVYVDGVEKSLTTDFTVSGGDGSTGTVAISVTGASGGSTVVITRDIPLERTTDFPVSGAFNIVALNTELDRLVAVAADLDDLASRAITPLDYDPTVSYTLPTVDNRKGKTLAFNEVTGSVQAGPSIADTQSVADASADIALLADIQDGTVATNAITTAANVSSQIATLGAISSDITTVSGISSNVTTVASNDANVTTVAGISSNVTTVADNIADINTVADDLNEAVSEINTVATDITNVNTVGTNITNVNTTAGSINNVNTVASDITNVNTVSTNISNVNTVAGISANVTTVAGQTTNLQNVTDNLTAIQNAASNATSASNSATAAAASAAAAALSADTFDDTYLGSKASDPSLDNDGDALNAGDLYFNTTSNTLKVYSGSAWQDAAVDSSGFVQTTGDSMTGNLSFGDNDKAIFGAGSDLQIYHSGTDSVLKENGTGDIIVAGNNLGLRTSDLNEFYLRAIANGEVGLYYDNAIKLATTSTGIDVTGTVTADGLTVDGSVDVNHNSITQTANSPRIDLIEADVTNLNTRIWQTAGDLRIYSLSDDTLTYSERIRLDHATGDISFYEDTGTTAKFFWDASAESLGIGTSSPSDKLHVQSSGDTKLKVETTNTTAASGHSGLSLNTGNGGYLLQNLTTSDSTHGVLRIYDTANSAERMRIDSSGRVGIGTSSPSAAGSGYGALDVRGAAGGGIRYGVDGGFNMLTYATGSSVDFYTSSAANVRFFTQGSGTESMRIDSSGNVGIGTSSPSSYGSAGNDLVIASTSAGLTIASDPADSGHILFADSTTGTGAYTGFIRYDHTTNSMRFAVNAGVERMRIDSSGNLLVGTTTTTNLIGGTGNDGVILTPNHIEVGRSGGAGLFINRYTSDGDIAEFRKDGTTVGSIGTYFSASTRYLYISGASPQECGIGFYANGIYPSTANGSFADNSKDLGVVTVRWDDVYATNGTIQTSDQNEKQQIASLTDAEITAAKAISKLFKTFKWNDSVAEKGDAARTHTGVIAQEVEQAMTDAGLNAGDYAFFISSTWWETYTEVPAVEADEENGVEAQEAYTRTDTYETAEEAPEGATERNRKGIRYPQLLSFIGAATEQRLAFIEARLDALEA